MRVAISIASVIGDRVRALTAVTELLVPWDRGDVLAAVHREGQVISEAAEEEGMRLRARLEPASVGALRSFVVTGGSDDARADDGSDDERADADTTDDARPAAATTDRDRMGA